MRAHSTDACTACVASAARRPRLGRRTHVPAPGIHHGSRDQLARARAAGHLRAGLRGGRGSPHRLDHPLSKATRRRRQAGAREHHHRGRLDADPGGARRDHLHLHRAHDEHARPARRRRARAGDGPPVVVGGALPAGRSHGRQRDPSAGRAQHRREPGVGRCDPQFLGAAVGRQDRRGAGAHQPCHVPRRHSRSLPGPVRRVLRTAARPHALRSGGGESGRVLRLAGAPSRAGREADDRSGSARRAGVPRQPVRGLSRRAGDTRPGRARSRPDARGGPAHDRRRHRREHPREPRPLAPRSSGRSNRGRSCPHSRSPTPIAPLSSPTWKGSNDLLGHDRRITNASASCTSARRSASSARRSSWPC